MQHSARQRRKRTRVSLGVAGALCAAALSAGVLAGALPAGGRADRTQAAELPPPAVTRESVWRAIFARPPAADAAPAEQAKIALGYDLFRDVRLSGDGRTSCAVCHDPARAFTDGRKTGRGPAGATLARNVPSLYNLAWATSFFWDGREASLAAQARRPIEAADEMAADLSVVTRRLAADPDLRERFAQAFAGPDAVSETGILEALAAYERSLVSPPTRFDRWVEGDDGALTAQEVMGFDLFVGKAGCVSCHGGWRFTDDGFHDIGLPGDDRGRGALAADGAGLPQFKTPSLRELAHTAPYMHDGTLATLDAVVDHYAGGFVRRPSLAATLVRDLVLADDERAALVAFLGTLSALPDRHTTDGTTRPMVEK